MRGALGTVPYGTFYLGLRFVAELFVTELCSPVTRPAGADTTGAVQGGDRPNLRIHTDAFHPLAARRPPRAGHPLSNLIPPERRLSSRESVPELYFRPGRTLLFRRMRAALPPGYLKWCEPEREMDELAIKRPGGRHP